MHTYFSSSREGGEGEGRARGGWCEVEEKVGREGGGVGWRRWWARGEDVVEEKV